MTDGDELWQMMLRRGFINQSAELYGGISGFYDYGILGARLKRNFEDLWIDHFLSLDSNFHLLDTSHILPEEVFRASGHLEHFDDPVVECRDCGNRERADHLLEDELGEKFEGISQEDLNQLIEEHGIDCHKCGGRLGDARRQNLMFPVKIGVDNQQRGFLRPETAQSAYINFSRSFEVARKEMPLGLATVGRAFRNEISPRQGVYRLREFTQAELQIFVDPQEMDDHARWDEVKTEELRMAFSGERDEIKEVTCAHLNEERDVPIFFLYHAARMQEFYLEELGVPSDRLRFYVMDEEERAFYNEFHWDLEIDLESLGGFSEVSAVHYRTDHDLRGHEEESGEEQEVFANDRQFVPHVVEMTTGVDRTLYALMELTFDRRDDKNVLSLPPELAPRQVAVFPLVSKDGLDSKAENVYADIRNDFRAVYDDSGSIGKRYARQDEVGTPYCVTVDYDTMEDDTVTVRDRDSGEQIRTEIDELPDTLRDLLSGELQIAGEEKG